MAVASYPPFVNAYGKLPELFSAIEKAAVPPKFTIDFIATKLGLKSSSYRAMIPLLKRLGFLDGANVPTESYRLLKDQSNAKKVMAARLREAYGDLFSAHEYAHELPKNELTNKLQVITGAGRDDKSISSVTGTFLELAKLADFDGGEVNVAPSSSKESQRTDDYRHSVPHDERRGKLGISYTINLNLPATTEVEVFNAIFKSLKEHILAE